MTTLSLIVATIVAIIIGSLWYSKFLFGNIWSKISGITMGVDSSGNPDKMVKQYIVQMIFTIFTVITLSHLLAILGITNVAGALELALWIWFGLQTPLLINPVLWERKQFAGFVLSSMFYLVTTIAITITLVLI